MTSRIAGISAAETMFEAMGAGARGKMADLLAEIAKDALAIQQDRTPVDSGDLKAGETAWVQAELLRARVGLLNTKRGRSKLFYGRPVDRGIQPQVVLVQRRRRVDGLLRTQARGRRKRATDIVATYALNVKAREGAGFIEAPDLGAIADAKLAAFWDQLEASGGAA